MNYERDIKIDASALDTEWLDQASLMMKYSINAADTRRDLDQAKEKLDFVKAELDKDIRSNPEKFGIEKITDKVVENTIVLQTSFKQTNQELIEAKYEADIAQSAVKAFDARKDALENLVRLHGQQYFAGPRIPRDLQKEWEEKQKKSNNIVGSKMVRKTD